MDSKIESLEAEIGLLQAEQLTTSTELAKIRPLEPQAPRTAP
jgi:hypothetical protein